MKVKLSIIDRTILKLALILSNLSFAIGQRIHKKYDPKHIYNTHTFDSKKCREIIFSNESDES